MYRGHTVYRNKYVIKTLKRKLSVRQVMAMGRINVCVCVCVHTESRLEKNVCYLDEETSSQNATSCIFVGSMCPMMITGCYEFGGFV